nr:unnamed protein product [Callosobruchus chinensis]
MIWHEHVSPIATAAGKKFGYLSRARKYFSPSNLLTLYKAPIRPSLEYCSHTWRQQEGRGARAATPREKCDRSGRSLPTIRAAGIARLAAGRTLAPYDPQGIRYAESEIRR